MKSRTRLGLPYVVIVLSNLLLAACGDSTINVPLTAASTSSLKVVAVDELKLPAGGTAYLSPDGKLIAWTAGQDLCIYTATGQKQNCATINKSIDRYTIRWSPDSTRLAFTQNFTQIFDEPDILVMDVATGAITNLTEDGRNGFISSPQNLEADNIDLEPSWSADGKNLLFIRYRAAEKATILELYVITADGKGTPQKVGELESYRNQNSVLVLAADGKKIGYNRGFDVKEKNSGIWLADFNGKNPARLLKETGSEPRAESSYIGLEFSADGKYILGLNRAEQNLPRTYETESNNRIAPVDGNSEIAVAIDKQAWWAGWSPKGSALIYLAYDKNQSGFLLYMTDKPGGTSRAIYDQPLKPYPNRVLGLTWAANNTVLAINRDNKVVLLHLG